ncbi:MAG: transcriptional regulator [Verrucomicrobiota bacterium]
MINFNKLDKVIHEKGRLSIMTLLATRVEWSFQDLKNELDMSDGNLITHLRALVKKGFVSAKKEQTGRRPQSHYALTDQGRKAFKEYIEILETIVNISRD